MIFWLMLTITTMLPHDGIASRTLLIPFMTSEACETARTGIVQINKSGVQLDESACVTFAGAVVTETWPDQRPYAEKQEDESNRLVRLNDDAEKWKREYAQGLHRQCDSLTASECMKIGGVK